jgi:hypothetical protein
MSEPKVLLLDNLVCDNFDKEWIYVNGDYVIQTEAVVRGVYENEGKDVEEYPYKIALKPKSTSFLKGMAEFTNNKYVISQLDIIYCKVSHESMYYNENSEIPFCLTDGIDIMKKGKNVDLIFHVKVTGKTTKFVSFVIDEMAIKTPKVGNLLKKKSMLK